MTLRFRTVLFDCDSTLADVEGIDELGREHRAAVADRAAYSNALGIDVGCPS